MSWQLRQRKILISIRSGKSGAGRRWGVRFVSGMRIFEWPNIFLLQRGILRLPNWPITEKRVLLWPSNPRPQAFPGTCVLASLSPRKRAQTSSLVDADESSPEYLSRQPVFNVQRRSIVVLEESTVKKCCVSHGRIPRRLSQHLTIRLPRNGERSRHRAFAVVQVPSPVYGGKGYQLPPNSNNKLRKG